MLRVLFEDSQSDRLDNKETKELFEKAFKMKINYNIILRGRDEKNKKQKKKRQP